MDGVDRRRSGTRSLKQRLGFNCCGGPTWSFRSTTVEEEQEDDNVEEVVVVDQIQQLSFTHLTINDPDPDPVCSNPEVSDSTLNHMNLAAALAAERELRAAEGGNSSNGTEDFGGVAPGTPFRMSLMRLLAETDGGDAAEVGGCGGEGVKEGNDSVCCVCMVRKKGAAFIPCGHTYCRVCSREVWLNRGSCPLCNRSIAEILDIF